MAPVVRFAQLPEMQAGGEQRTIYAVCELLHAGVQRLPPRSARGGLNDSRAGIRFHQLQQTRQTRAAHHAVGVEHDHIDVVFAPAPAEVGDIAALALDAVLPPAVEHPIEALDGAACLLPSTDFGDARVGVARIGEHEEIEMRQCAALRNRLVGRSQACEHARHVLVSDRHDDRGAHGGSDRRIGRRSCRDRVAVAFEQQQDVAGHRGPEPA